jgi:hypothetical protein
MSKTRSKTPESEHVFVYGTLRPPRADTPEDDSRYYPQVTPYVQAVTSAQRLQGTLYDLSTHPDPVDAIIIEGWATLALGVSPQLQPLFVAKYNWDIDSSPNYDTIIEITPTKLLAWRKNGQGWWPGAEVLRGWYF